MKTVKNIDSTMFNFGGDGDGMFSRKGSGV